MLIDQNSRYANAVGNPSVGAKVGSDEIKNPVSISRGSKSINSVRPGMYSKSSYSSSRTKTMSLVTSEEMIKRKRPRSMGSAAGFRGEKSAYLEINGSGYMRASRKVRSQAGLGSTPMAAFNAQGVKTSLNSKFAGRLAENSKYRIGKLKALSRLV